MNTDERTEFLTKLASAADTISARDQQLDRWKTAVAGIHKVLGEAGWKVAEASEFVTKVTTNPEELVSVIKRAYSVLDTLPSAGEPVESESEGSTPGAFPETVKRLTRYV
jgi:ABC-type transporter Mla subunit MlaD